MSVPILDVTDWQRPGATRTALVRALGESLEQFGFVSCVGHGVSADLLDRAYAVAGRTFQLPTDVKRSYETPDDGRKRGYTSFGIEHAKDHAVADLKEFWHVGRKPAPDLSGVPANRFPTEVPDFAEVFEHLFEALDAFSQDLLRAVAAYLDLPQEFFVERVRGGNSLLRVIHYPPIRSDTAPGAIRAAAHEDVNLVTVLPASTAPGLELMTREGNWIEVVPPPGAMICDTGDMMQLITQGRLPATTHRVVNPPGAAAQSSRYALPFFVHPRPEVRLAPPDQPGSGPTAGDFLQKRLREIGLTDA